jgi:hypothetical protein
MNRQPAQLVFLKTMEEFACPSLDENSLVYDLKEKRTDGFAIRSSRGMAGVVRAAGQVATFRSITRSREAN